MNEQTTPRALAHRQRKVAQRLALEASNKLEQLAAAAEKEFKAKFASPSEVTTEAKAALETKWDDLQGHHDAELARVGAVSDAWEHWSRAAERAVSMLDLPSQPAECSPRNWWDG
jgi:hypothetical protein